MEKKMMPKKISSWSDLHSDMLSLIKSRLLAGDITNFNMICKPWRSITATSRLVFPPPIDSSLARAPCLVTLHKNVCEFYHPVYDATYKVDTPELSRARIRSSGYGWLLLTQNNNENVFFFNPFTKEKIRLPGFSRPNIKLTMTFSSPPTSPDCVVTGMAYNGLYTLPCIITVRRGDASWKFHGYPNNGYSEKFLKGAYCHSVFVNDKCYFLGEKGNIGVFDVKENMWQDCGEAWPQCLTCPASMVLEDDGKLLALFLSRENRQVRMCRFDISKMTWENVGNIGNDKMLYISDGTSFLETSVATGMGNKIYFPLFNRDNKSGVIYSMSSKKYHSSDGKYCSKSPFNLIELRSSAWIKPVYDPVADVEKLEWS